MVLNTDHYVYVKSGEYSWRPGKLLEQDGTTAKVSVPKFPSEQDIVSGQTNHSTETLDIKLKDYPNKTLPLQNVDEKGEFKPVIDMVDLMYLHEVRHILGISWRLTRFRNVLNQLSSCLFSLSVRSFHSSLQFCSI